MHSLCFYFIEFEMCGRAIMNILDYLSLLNVIVCAILCVSNCTCRLWLLLFWEFYWFWNECTSVVLLIEENRFVGFRFVAAIMIIITHGHDRPLAIAFTNSHKLDIENENTNDPTQDVCVCVCVAIKRKHKPYQNIEITSNMSMAANLIK